LQAAKQRASKKPIKSNKTFDLIGLTMVRQAEFGPATYYGAENRHYPFNFNVLQIHLANLLPLPFEKAIHLQKR